MMKRIFAFALLFVVTIGCGEKKQRQVSSSEIVRGVRLVQVQRTTVPDYVEAVGTVRALQSSELSSQIVATITAVNVHEGQRVSKGGTLIMLDDSQQRAALQRAIATIAAAREDVAASEADSGLANATLTRYRSLNEKKSVSPHEFDEVEARAKSATAHREQASARLEEAKAMEAQAHAHLGYTRIRAPFDGVITEKRVDAGALAAPGVSLLTIEDVSRFRLEAAVDEADISFVKLGALVPVVIDALEQEIPGRLVQVVPAADPASRTFMVKIELSRDSRVRSGLFGRARFAKGQRQVITIPRTAVLDRGQLQGVYVIATDSIAGLRYVTLGRTSGQEVEVLSGLQPGERLVAQAGDRELAGKKIEVQP